MEINLSSATLHCCCYTRTQCIIFPRSEYQTYTANRVYRHSSVIHIYQKINHVRSERHNGRRIYFLWLWHWSHLHKLVFIALVSNIIVFYCFVLQDITQNCLQNKYYFLKQLCYTLRYARRELHKSSLNPPPPPQNHISSYEKVASLLSHPETLIAASNDPQIQTILDLSRGNDELLLPSGSGA